MIKREICREEVAKLVSEYYLADCFDQQVALVDIIMDRLTSIPDCQLTVDKISKTIEEEIEIWLRH